MPFSMNQKDCSKMAIAQLIELPVRRVNAKSSGIQSTVTRKEAVRHCIRNERSIQTFCCCCFLVRSLLTHCSRSRVKRGESLAQPWTRQRAGEQTQLVCRTIKNHNGAGDKMSYVATWVYSWRYYPVVWVGNSTLADDCFGTLGHCIASQSYMKCMFASTWDFYLNDIFFLDKEKVLIDHCEWSKTRPEEKWKFRISHDNVPCLLPYNRFCILTKFSKKVDFFYYKKKLLNNNLFQFNWFDIEKFFFYTARG